MGSSGGVETKQKTVKHLTGFLVSTMPKKPIGGNNL